MGNTALQAQGEELGATSLSEYRGATTAARFGDPQAEFAALRTGCGVYDLGFRAKLSLTGSDRVRWLNGMVTNNIRDLALGQGAYAFLLNPQGHILGDLYAYNRGESVTVESDSGQGEKFFSSSVSYIRRDISWSIPMPEIAERTLPFTPTPGKRKRFFRRSITTSSWTTLRSRISP